MAMTSLDPLARQYVTDAVDISDLKWASLDDIVKRLTELQAEGYTDFDVETDEEYGETTATMKVTRSRPETDEEYAERMRFMENSRERRRQAYLRLHAEFGNEVAT